YLRSVYYAIVGMSTVGYGDIKPDPSNMLETNFSSCMILFGGLLLPAIVGGLASLMADLNKDIREYRAKFSELRLSMQRQKLNQPLQHALLQYHNYIWTRQNGADELLSLAASTLPHTLRARVCVAIRLPVLTRCPIFESCTEVIKRAIALYLMPETYSEGDLVIQFGDHGEAMHFLLTGTVQVVAENNVTIYATLKAGCYFGE
ncbi:hypothetical protein AURANDRAFT_5467, partial [Aureococcus anophagefferens]